MSISINLLLQFYDRRKSSWHDVCMWCIRREWRTMCSLYLSSCFHINISIDIHSYSSLKYEKMLLDDISNWRRWAFIECWSLCIVSEFEGIFSQKIDLIVNVTLEDHLTSLHLSSCLIRLRKQLQKKDSNQEIASVEVQIYSRSDTLRARIDIDTSLSKHLQTSRFNFRTFNHLHITGVPDDLGRLMYWISCVVAKNSSQ